MFNLIPCAAAHACSADEVAADAECTGSGGEKIGDVVHRYSANGSEAQL